jgi:hypothetical protein
MNRLVPLLDSLKLVAIRSQTMPLEKRILASLAMATGTARSSDAGRSETPHRLLCAKEAEIVLLRLMF